MKNLIKAAVAASAIISVSASAQDFYVSVAAGQVSPDDYTNNGQFSTAFTTGTVTGVNPPLALPAGTPVGWSTDLDSDMGFSLAVGLETEGLRYELEYSASDFDVNTHTGVSAGGIDLTDIDAGILISGNVGDLGVSTGALVADGQGSVDTSSILFNAYYDFDTDSAFTPYVGAGLGQMSIDVDYSPSGVGVINDDDSVLVYQLIVGASYELGEGFHAFANYKYRDGDDASVNATLFPASFDLEGNQTSILEAGIRFNF